MPLDKLCNDVINGEMPREIKKATAGLGTAALISPIRSSGHADVVEDDLQYISAEFAPAVDFHQVGSRSPSCWISVARLVNPPGTIPPVSGQWPVFER